VPKPYFPPHAGPYAPAWSAEPHASHLAGSEPHRRAAIEAEIERLRAELAEMPHEDGVAPEPVDNSRLSKTMLWCALLLCGAALLFAVFAVIAHG